MFKKTNKYIHVTSEWTWNGVCLECEIYKIYDEWYNILWQFQQNYYHFTLCSTDSYILKVAMWNFSSVDYLKC